MPRRVLVILVIAMACVGCGPKPPPIVPVEGRVMLNGKPLARAEVRFFPMIKFGGEYIAVGETDENGYYKLECMAQPGACACENRVTVTEGSVPEDCRGMSAESQARLVRYQASLKNRPIPGKYANLAQSPLKFLVSPDQKNYPIDLER
ncbi:MAG: hypothetical protein U0840_07245 [Gemmataceae bacterium]